MNFSFNVPKKALHWPTKKNTFFFMLKLSYLKWALNVHKPDCSLCPIIASTNSVSNVPTCEHQQKLCALLGYVFELIFPHIQDFVTKKIRLACCLLITNDYLCDQQHNL